MVCMLHYSPYLPSSMIVDEFATPSHIRRLTGKKKLSKTIPLPNPKLCCLLLLLVVIILSEMEIENDESSVVDIYPLSCYYFGSKDAVPDKDETLAERIQRFKSNFAAHGLRTCVEGVLLVELFQQPHVLLLQVKNSYFKLPGGRLRPGERDIDGLRRKLSRKLSLDDNGVHDDWQIGQCIGMWWKSEFETLPFPYLPPNTRRPKECVKLFLVRLPMSRQFVVPKNLKMLAVPLCQIHDNAEVYGPIISGIPHLLSKFSFNIINV